MRDKSGTRTHRRWTRIYKQAANVRPSDGYSLSPVTGLQIFFLIKKYGQPNTDTEVFYYNQKDIMPSDEHNDLIYRARTWLSNRVTGRGIRAASEVYIDEGYVADLVSLCSFQGRFFDRYLVENGLKPMRSEWQKNDATGKLEQVFVGNGVENYFACIFECKASRSDFTKTFGKSDTHINRMSPVGSFHWIVTTKKLVAIEKVPEFWGLLEACGNGLTEKKRPKLYQLDDDSMNKIAHDIIWPMDSFRWNERVNTSKKIRELKSELRKLKANLGVEECTKDKAPDDYF